VAHLLMGAGVVLVKNMMELDQHHPVCAYFSGFAISFLIAHPPLLC